MGAPYFLQQADGMRREREARAPRAAVRGVEGGKGERRVGRVGIVIDNCRKFLVLLIVEEKKTSIVI